MPRKDSQDIQPIPKTTVTYHDVYNFFYLYRHMFIYFYFSFFFLPPNKIQRFKKKTVKCYIVNMQIFFPNNTDFLLNMVKIVTFKIKAKFRFDIAN